LPANDDEGWRDAVEQFARPSTHQRQPRRSWAGIGVGVVLMIVILAGTVLYSHQSGSLAALGVNLEELVGVSWKNPAQTSAPDNVTQDSVAELNRRHVRVTASRDSRFFLGSPNGEGVLVPRIEPKNLQPYSPSDGESSKRETTAATSGDIDKPPPSEAKNRTKERSSYAGTLRVYDASFVRDKPRSDANITGTLEPGTRIRVQSKTGDYFRVRSLDREPISGYVHREDAFFEPTK
jgi:hypothetical protein